VEELYQIYSRGLEGFHDAPQGNRKLIWVEEFNYSGLPDPKKWVFEKGFIGNNEPQLYTDRRLQNCRVENGNLVIEAIKEVYPNPAYICGTNDPNTRDSLAQYTSADITTQGIFNLQYGRVEVRAKVPMGKGMWPAIWMLGKNLPQVGWPACGEIDIMEILGRDSSNLYGTIHYADVSCNHAQNGTIQPVGDPAADFHIYAMDWTQDRIELYYDQLKHYTFFFSTASYSGSTFKKPFYLLRNLALGHAGGFAGPVDNYIFSQKFLVDYVRIYQ